MNLLYLECHMGAAGDMLMSALFELLGKQQQEQFLQTMKKLTSSEIEIIPETTQKCGITGTHMKVLIQGEEEEHHHHEHHNHHQEEHHHHHQEEHYHHEHHDHYQEEHHHHEHHEHHQEEHHHHFNMNTIRQIIGDMNLSEQVKYHAEQIYQMIGEAESAVHGVPVEQVHFHEVGSLDAIADIVGCCLLLEMLKPEQIVVSPIHVGSGSVHCAHGILPVPAPATARILTDIPIYSSSVKGELCTPTGAALLKYFADRFDSMPMMVVKQIGYGMGSKEFEQANCIRAFWGTLDDHQDSILELVCNLDDMTAEALGLAQEILLQHGALDVFATPIQTKKNRPAYLLTCLCKPEQKQTIVKLILKHTTTLGVRESICKRNILTSQSTEISTVYGTIRMKVSTGYGIIKYKPEFEDVKNAAKQFDLSYEEVYRQAIHTFETLADNKKTFSK